MNKRKIAVVFGGRSSEHDVSLMSAASVIRAINKERYELVYLGITRAGVWKRLVLPAGEGPAFAADVLEKGTWQDYSEDFNMSDIVKVADFALPIIHGPYCEDGKLIVDVDGDGFDGGVMKIVGTELFVNWGDRLELKGPMFVFKINVCPMCGRDLKG